MGTAHYKAGKYTQALSSFSRVQAGSENSDKDSERTARTAYNMGNTQYKLGAQAEEQNPQAALAAYTDALALYRRALGADPTDQDAKFNYEFVTKRIEACKVNWRINPNPASQINPNKKSSHKPNKTTGNNSLTHTGKISNMPENSQRLPLRRSRKDILAKSHPTRCPRMKPSR